MSRFYNYIEEKCGGKHNKDKKKKKKEKVNEAIKLIFGGLHLKDNILDPITVEDLQTMIESNLPNEKINVKTAQKEFETLLRMKTSDARHIVKKVINDLVKNK